MVLKGGYNRAKEIEPEYKKRCSSCGIEKDKREFDINQIQSGDRLVRRGECKSCRAWKKPVPQKVKDIFIKQNPRPKLGEDFHCPVCKRKKPVINSTSVALDHDHHTGKIRGYVCLACNTGMGNLKDDVGIVGRALKWLKGTLYKSS